MKYPIQLEGRPVGEGHIVSAGLYCHICCRCDLPQAGLYQIYLCGENDRLDLGICIPMEGAFGIETKIPVKKIPKGELGFQLSPRNQQKGRFVPVAADEPFPYLQFIRTARFTVQNGVPGLLLSEAAPNQPGNDLSP